MRKQIENTLCKENNLNATYWCENGMGDELFKHFIGFDKKYSI